MRGTSQPPKEGPITKALREAVELRRGLMADGTPEHEADHIVGQGLKAVLANPRPEPWHFYCQRCRDTGWINVDPSPQEHARIVAMYGDASHAAGYLSACDPCVWRQREREKRRQQLGIDGGGGDDDFVMAGKTKRGFRRAGP